MHVDYIVVGQGICGTFLSWYLLKENKNVIVVDNALPRAASRVAAGIINPVTGRRYARSWMIDIVLPFATEAYESVGTELELPVIAEKSVIHFFPTPDMQQNFLNRISENEDFLKPFPDHNRFRTQFDYPFNCGEIRPAYMADLNMLLPAWRKKLQDSNQLIEEKFNYGDLIFSVDGVRYQSIEAKSIIFCDGINSGSSPWFSNLPFSFNKGEALILRIPDLSPGFIYKKNLTLAPLQEPELFWAGGHHEWTYQDDLPEPRFKEIMENQLKRWLKLPYTVEGHVAGIRPATVERRPFVGMHPSKKNIGILNGMGSKGCSLAPYFAHQLCQHLLYGKPLHAAADISRFRRVLEKTEPF